MTDAATGRMVSLLILSAACTAGSAALPPAESLSACPETRASLPRSTRDRPAHAVPATAWRSRTDSYALVSVDADTLQPRGRAVDIGSQQDAWLRVSSPDGRSLAVGGDGEVIEVIDLERRGAVDRFAVGRRQAFLSWPHRRWIMAVVGSNESHSAVIIDAAEGRVVARSGIPGHFIGAAASNDTIAAITSRPRRPGGGSVTHLWVLNASGEATATRLGRIASGYRSAAEDSGDRLGHSSSPGVAVLPSGDRAFVFGVDGVVAEISVATGSVSYGRLGGPYPWAALSVAEAKFTNYSQVLARWLPSGLVAVSGHDQRLVARGRWHVDHRFDPSGVALFDPETGRACMLDERADSMLVADEVLLVFRAMASGAGDGMGVAAYTMRGERLWHRFGHDAVDFVQVLDGYAYVTTSWQGWKTFVVELSTGRVIRSNRGRPPDLASAASSRPELGGV